MPGGHASHKSTSNKPNTNAEGKIDIAAETSIEPEDILPEGVMTNTTRTQEFVDYPPATERPSSNQAKQDDSES